MCCMHDCALNYVFVLLQSLPPSPSLQWMPGTLKWAGQSASDASQLAYPHPPSHGAGM